MATMKSIQRIISTLLLIGFSVVGFSTMAQTDGKAPKRDTIIIKGDCDFPPYEFLNEKGEPDGFTIELTHAIMKELDIPYKIELDVWYKVLEEFREGKVDILTSVTSSKERSKEFVMGPIHSHTHPIAITYKNAPPVKNKKELVHRTLIVQKGDIYHHLLQKEGFKSLITADRISDAFRLLPETENGVVFCDNKMARSIIYRYGFKDLTFSDIELPSIGYCYASNDTELMSRISYAFAIVNKKGIYSSLYNKWLAESRYQEVSSTIYLIIAGLAVTAFILYLFVILLRGRVKKATAEAYKYVKRIEEILQFSEITIWEYDIKTKNIALFEGIHKVTRHIKYRAYIDHLLPEMQKETEELFNRLNKGLEESFKLEQTYSWNGGIKHMIINGAPIYDEKEKITKYTGMIRDITDLKEIQISLNIEKERAEQSDKLKSAFLANMRHEIRTPLNAIIGFSNLLQNTDSPEDRNEFMKIINTNNDLLLRLIDDILDLSKIEAGVVDLYYQEFDLNELLDSLVRSLQPRLEDNKEVKMILKLPQKSCFIYLDYNRLLQLVTNFALNAIKNTPAGMIQIGYSCHINGVHLFVEDTGIGIPASEHHRIFRRFEKVNDFVQGSGLGLSICKAIVDTFKGEIGFTSEVGKGSTFWAWIPCKVIKEKN